MARSIIELTAAEYTNYFDQENPSRFDAIDIWENKGVLVDLIMDGVQSGGFLNPVYLAAVDKYGQVVSTNKGQLIKAELIEYDSPKKANDDFKTRIEGNTNFFSAYGVYNISGLLLEASGGAVLSLDLNVDDVI